VRIGTFDMAAEIATPPRAVNARRSRASAARGRDFRVRLGAVLDARPKAKAIDLSQVKLSPEEGFVLSRVDGATSVKDLVTLTGLDEERILGIVERLAAEGVIELPRDEVEEQEQEQEQGQEQGEVEEEPREEGEVEEEPREEQGYRHRFETVFHPMQREERLAAVAGAQGADLCALCFDPDPQVIHAVLSSRDASLEHARLVALHHRTHAGLEVLARKTEVLADALVQRRLLRNPQLPNAILNRLVTPKMLLDVYKLAIDREIPERSRVMTRDLLRKKFTVASSDEKAALLFKTEGRCLLLLVQCSLDAHATQILCSKSGYTVLFMQNLARWSATPPALLAHLLKTPFARRNLGLRKMLLKHPNMPSEAKRQG
jgi:hypothetical protein